MDKLDDLAQRSGPGSDRGLMDPRIQRKMEAYWKPHEESERRMDSLVEQKPKAKAKKKRPRSKRRHAPQLQHKRR